MKTRITFYKMEYLMMGEGLGQKKKFPKFGGEKGTPDSLVSSKWWRLKSIGPRTGEPGKRDHTRQLDTNHALQACTEARRLALS